jgi:DNA-binding transcriptional LysR family regulator
LDHHQLADTIARHGVPRRRHHDRIAAGAPHRPRPRQGTRRRVHLRLIHPDQDLAARHGVAFDDLPIFLVLPNNEAVRRAVEAGAGATIISEHVVAHALADGTLRQVPAEIPARSFSLIAHSERAASQAARALKAHLGAGRRPAK